MFESTPRSTRLSTRSLQIEVQSYWTESTQRHFAWILVSAENYGTKTGSQEWFEAPGSGATQGQYCDILPRNYLWKITYVNLPSE